MFALDYDGVIADANALKSHWLRDHLGIDVPSYDCDLTSCVPIIGMETYETMAVDIFGEEGTAAAPPVPGVEEALQDLAALGPVYIITARDERRATFSQQWLDMRGFTRYIHGLIAQNDQPDRPKVEVARELGCRALIEDDSRHLIPGFLPQLVHLRVGMEKPVHVSDGRVVCSTWPDAVSLLTEGV